MPRTKPGTEVVFQVVDLEGRRRPPGDVVTREHVHPTIVPQVGETGTVLRTDEERVVTPGVLDADSVAHESVRSKSSADGPSSNPARRRVDPDRRDANRRPPSTADEESRSLTRERVRPPGDVSQSTATGGRNRRHESTDIRSRRADRSEE